MDQKWYLDSGCSRHMTGNKRWLSKLEKKNGGNVTFGDNKTGKNRGIGEISIDDDVLVKNILFVDGIHHNLISVSQLCDNQMIIEFTRIGCNILDEETRKVLLVGKRVKNIYIIDLEEIRNSRVCLVAKYEENEVDLWHRRLGHLSYHSLKKLVSLKLVRGLPLDLEEKPETCKTCIKSKHVKSSFDKKIEISTKQPLQLLHMDLFGPNRVSSLGGKLYGLVIVDDYSRYTWVHFLSAKSDTVEVFESFINRIQNEFESKVKIIRTDHVGEFENKIFDELCNTLGIFYQYSAPRTPQQNGVAERKNRTLIEMSRTMLAENHLPSYFWAEVVSTACYVANRVLVRPQLKKTPYELLKERKPNITFFRAFGCKCYILVNGKEDLGKFDSRSDEGIFLGYSERSKAYWVFNKRTLVVEESIHVEFVEKRIDRDQIASHQSTSIKEKGDDQVRHHDDQSSSKDDAPPNHATVDPLDEIDSPLPRPWQFD